MLDIYDKGRFEKRYTILLDAYFDAMKRGMPWGLTGCESMIYLIQHDQENKFPGYVGTGESSTKLVDIYSRESVSGFANYLLKVRRVAEERDHHETPYWLEFSAIQFVRGGRVEDGPEFKQFMKRRKNERPHTPRRKCMFIFK